MFSIFILLLAENVLSSLSILIEMEDTLECATPVDLGIWLMVTPESFKLEISVGRIVVLWTIHEWRSCKMKWARSTKVSASGS